jgi:hypothetical protein
MNCGRLTVILMVILFSVSTYAANAFLDAPNDQPVSAKFRGTEWSDDIGQQDIPLTAKVVTTRMAKMPWGAIFKVEFTDLKSRADKPREIRLDYFIVTNDRIVLLNEEDNDAAAKKISTLDKPPDFEPNDIYGITSGSFEHQEGEWKTTIKLKGTSAFMMRVIPLDISKKSSGKRASDWLNTPAATVHALTDIGSNVK